MKKENAPDVVAFDDKLLNELSQLIEQSQDTAVAVVNSTLTLLFWHIGKKINDSILQNKRAGYGKSIVVTLSRELTDKYGRNFEEKNLRRMLQFAEQYNDREIVVTLSRQLADKYAGISRKKFRHGRTTRQQGGIR